MLLPVCGNNHNGADLQRRCRRRRRHHRRRHPRPPGRSNSLRPRPPPAPRLQYTSRSSSQRTAVGAEPQQRRAGKYHIA